MPLSRQEMTSMLSMQTSYLHLPKKQEVVSHPVTE